MIKVFFILGLLLSLQIETNAQQENQFTGPAYFTTSVELNTLSKKMYLSDNTPPDKDADFYLRKSKNQRIVGWATLGGGIVLSGVGLLIASNNEGSYVDIYGNTNGRDNTTLAAVLTMAGAVSGIVSIPFMIMATANKHKARAILKSQPTGFGAPPNVNKQITGISMIIPIGK